MASNAISVPFTDHKHKFKVVADLEREMRKKQVKGTIEIDDNLHRVNCYFELEKE